MTSTLVTIPGYRILEEIYDGSRTRVYRGRCESEQKPVVIKLLKSEYPTFNELVQFRNQYTIAKNLDLPGIIQAIALLNYRNGFALVMEDIGGVSLSEEMGRSSNSLKEFFNIAIQIVQTLEGLYKNRIIHKDIKPQNILINPETREVKLIDFSISSLLPRENQEIQNPNVLEGTLAYISPEQTGRMNRGIDYRTDFYSLGVTFYELLTGQLPFQSTDPMELVHCHIARIPTPPIELVPSIPLMVNDIVMKLMAKTAEERYQTAFGLRYDLETCWQQYSEKGSISQFPLGQRDISEHFVIPEKLYGREAEVATLLAAFDRVANSSQCSVLSSELEDKPQNGLRPASLTKLKTQNSRSELMLVAGFSGIGKTAVVNEVHKPIVRQRGYFIKGKFDQFKRDIPFSAWVQAFQNLMRQLLTETTAEVSNWKAGILAALGQQGKVIIDVIPELELLIGKQPAVPELEGSAAQNRFNLLFGKFIRVFTTKEHPLVIFLDDLQWADSASLKLMQLLMSEASGRYLLLIGAYRDNEVNPAHPLMLTLDEIRKANDDRQDACPTVNQITLAPLDSPSLNRLIADTLSCPPERAVPLTELVQKKTKGNPFFSNQFLKSLHEDGLISFDPPDYVPLGYQSPRSSGGSKGGWQCDIAKVRALALTDDVVEFMALQLQKLPINTQTVLKLAACIGNQFNLATLAIVHEKSQAETASDLWKSLQDGLVIPETEVYKFFTGEESEFRSHNSEFQAPGFIRGVNPKSKTRPQDKVPWRQNPKSNDSWLLAPDSCSYRFLHDRVQQAAYFLIPESQKQSTHLKIGQLLLNNTPEEEREEKIFDIVNQLNIGVELITQQTERDELAQLNLIAGRKAKASTAYAAAKRYLTVGIKLLSAKAWQSQYELTLALHEEAAEAAYLSGDFEQMEQLADLVRNQARSLLDKVKVYEVNIQACMVRNQMDLALQMALQALSLLGVNFPEKPNQSDIQLALSETTSNLMGKRIEDLIDLPIMSDPSQLAVMRLLSSLIAGGYIAAPELLPLITFKQVSLQIKQGNAAQSPFAYAMYGTIVCGVILDIDSGYQFGNLALNLLERLNAKQIQSKTLLVVHAFITHWKAHIRDTLNPLQDGYQSGIENGDLEFAGYSALTYCEYSYFIGQPMTELDQKMASYIQALDQLKQVVSVNWLKIYLQSVRNLNSTCPHPERLIGQVYDESKTLPLLQQANDRYGLFNLYTNKVVLAYLFQDFYQATESATLAEQYLDGATGHVGVAILHFYNSLARLMLYPHVANSEQADILNKVAANQEKMKLWADHAPMNYLHKFYLVEAERHRVQGSYLEAMDYYDRAITTAKENEYINEEALANELAFKFYLEWGKDKIAQVYLTDAYYGYARWGAKAKVEDLERRYSQLLAPVLNSEKSLNTGETIAQMNSATIHSTSTSTSEVLDLSAVIKASQTLSGEIQLDKLFSNLMEVVIENAGAEKGVLILLEGDSLVIVAQCVNSKKCNLRATPLLGSQEIPVTLINYVWRTQETLVLNDANAEVTFAADSYIIQHQPKSVLCTPIKNQGKPIGILYLENNLTTGAFTPDRLEVLKVLSSQAAISIENARLYDHLEEYNRTLETKVEERTQELSQTLSHLKATQEELIQSEKMAALGQLIAGIAHEINTPLGAIRSSIENIADFLHKNLEQLPAFFQTLSKERQQDFFALLQKSTQQSSLLSSKENRQFKRSLKRQIEEHNIENADTIAETLIDIGVYDELEPFLPLLKDPESQTILDIAYKFATLQKSTQTITTATTRAAKVVFALKTYAHYDSTSEMVRANIIAGIETVLTLYQSQLKQGVEVSRNYEKSLPSILCYPDQLNQVWTNLIHNALQAMDNQGNLKLEVRQQEEQILIGITDSGKGIPPEVMPRIFEPFFTTKPPGEGSGLGLDIVKKIIEKHEGTIEVESEPGKTTFTVFLPIKD
jgi:predicted ATPase/signal transduction histidine kinase